MANVVNGLDPQQIQGMVDAVKKDPTSAQAKFSAGEKTKVLRLLNLFWLLLVIALLRVLQ